MSTATIAEQLERQLAAARSEESRKKREDALAQIERLSDEGAQLKALLAPLQEQINGALNERLRLNGLLRQARSQVLAYSAPLDPLTFPSQADKEEHARQLGLWKEGQRKLLAANTANEARMGVDVRLNAARLARRLETVAQEISNLTAVAEGRRPGETKGGLSYVGEDFIGNSQLPPRHST